MTARFFRSDAMVSTLGETPEKTIEAEWFQLTYSELRTAPDGDFVAFYSGKDDCWYVGQVAFSDVVIYEFVDMGAPPEAEEE